MNLRIYKLFLAIALLTSTIGSACTTDAGGPRVILHTHGGDVPVTVEVADTPDRRSLGLMYRKELAADAGMIFVFDEPEHLTFWMKNTVLPLDMIFIGEDRHVLGIVKNAVPFTTTPRGVGGESRYVLEVNAGFSDRHGVTGGDTVTFEGVPGTPP
jgi:uncharacterized membrane protein (UPF0127 family)